MNYAPRGRETNAHLEQIGDDAVEGGKDGSNEGGERDEEGLDTADDSADGLEDAAEVDDDKLDDISDIRVEVSDEGGDEAQDSRNVLLNFAQEVSELLNGHVLSIGDGSIDGRDDICDELAESVLDFTKEPAEEGLDEGDFRADIGGHIRYGSSNSILNGVDDVLDLGEDCTDVHLEIDTDSSEGNTDTESAIMHTSIPWHGNTGTGSRRTWHGGSHWGSGSRGA